MAEEPVVRREEVASALEARRELGKDYEREIVDSFVERIEQRLDERQRRPKAQLEPHRSVTPLALGSIVLAIGATAVAGDHMGRGGIAVAIIAWIAITLVNIAYAMRR